MLSAVCFVMLASTPPTAPVPLEAAEMSALQALDEGLSLPAIRVRSRDRTGWAWFCSVVRDETPRNPFPKGSVGDREVRALEAFLADPRPRIEDLDRLELRWGGSQLRLWKVGRDRVQAGRWGSELRKAWEDRLLALDVSPFLRGWALRHALCFALAEEDGERFGQLREALEEEAPDLFQAFQRAFGLLGGPAPRFPLWTLPDLEPVELNLAEHPGARVHIGPASGDPIRVPSDATLWIVPTELGGQPVAEPFLQGREAHEAQELAERFRRSGLRGYVAASRRPFEAVALVFFPALLDVDEQGRLRSIRMGDAARPQPKPIP